MVSCAENQKGCRKNPFHFFKQIFYFESEGFKYFYTKFELEPNWDKLK
jgi:hypothetical protein